MKDSITKIEKISVPEKALVKVYWDDRPENHTYEGKQRIKSYFSKKYGIPTTSINVVTRAIKTNSNGELINLSDGVIDNIMDITYQRELFKEWLEREKIEVEWDRIIKLDDKVNEEYNLIKTNDYRYRRWQIKRIEIDNFLSFGDGNKIEYEDLNGLTIVASSPANQSGKCLRGNTEINITTDHDYILNKVGYIPEELKLGNFIKTTITLKEISDIFQKYGDLNIKVLTEFGFKKINNAGITEYGSRVYNMILENGFEIFGSPNHKVKMGNSSFISLKEIMDDFDVNMISNIDIRTFNGVSKVIEINDTNTIEDLYDIEVDEVQEYYSNGIVSHNSTFSVDALRFLFFGDTTKTDRNEEIFNSFRDSNNVRVKGWISIDGDDYIIERKIKRTPKKAGGWSVSTSVEYKKILPDGTEEDLKGEQSIDTTKKIEESIGNDKDFMTTIIATGDNLNDLIESKPTERGKTLTRFIGLEVLEEKEEIVKKLSSDFYKSMKSNIYNIEDLKNEIEDHKNSIIQIKEDNIKKDERLDELGELISQVKLERDSLLSKKVDIDPSILKINPMLLKDEIEELSKKGISKKDELDRAIKLIDELGEVNYNEKLHTQIKNEKNELEFKKRENNNEIVRLERHIKSLKEGEICPTCKRSLDDVDHTNEIEASQKDINERKSLILDIDNKINELIKEISKHDQDKSKSDNIDRQILTKDKLEVDLERMRLSLKDKKTSLKEYEKNTKFIDDNKKLESEIVNVDSKINLYETEKNGLIRDIERNKSLITQNENNIADKEKLIVVINKEREVQRIFEIYTKMIGKNGIGKLVLRSVIPIINSEIQQMLDGLCDFELELNINDKNEVEFLLIKNFIPKPIKSGSGFEKTLASLALRIVLGKISTLPKPNIIVMDEVLGKVADENLSLMKPFFDRIKSGFDVILLITHREIVKDWADHVLMIKKENDISTIHFN